MPRKLMLLVLLVTATVLAACSSPANLDALVPAPERPAFSQVTPAFDPFVGAPDIGALRQVPQIWFVDVDARPLVDGGSVGTLSASVDAVQAAAADAGVSITPRYTFSTFVSGFSAELSAADLLTLSTLPGVRRIMPVGIVDAPVVQRHQPWELSPDMTTAVDMTGASFVQSELGWTGAGVKVGIIDTGILWSHPEFAGQVPFGFDFVGDAYDAGDPANDVPVPYPGPGTREDGGDCNGHGTHVAGIVGASGAEITGVAPGVELAAYRVFGCSGSSNSDVILAAIEQAFADGMDVVNLSLGSANGWPQDFLSEALGRMLELDMIPVASAGNNGANGVYTIGAPGAGADVVTVASFDNTAAIANLMVVEGNDVGYNVLTFSTDPPTEGTSPEIVYLGQACDADPLPEGVDATDKVALITRGACTFAEKYLRAVGAGAAGVVIENNSPGNFAGTLGEALGEPWAISISGTNGTLIKDLIDAEAAPVITWTDETILEGNPTANLVSTFSSYGLAPDLSLKPDIGAPGGLINSTYIEGADIGVPGSPTYAVLSGTSMASPHVAGAIALFLEARPEVPRSRVRDMLMNVADPQLWNLNPLPFLLDSVHRQGAGMLRIDNAILNQTYVLPAKLALGEAASGPYVGVMTLHNDTDAPITYALTQIEALDLYPVATVGDSFVPDFDFAVPTVEYYALRQSSNYQRIGQIVVPAGGTASFQVRVIPDPAWPDTLIYGTYLLFFPLDAEDAPPLLVPAAGIAGDYQNVPVYWLPPSTAGIYGGDLFLLPADWAFTMRDGDVPGFLFGLSHGVERAYAEIVPQGERAWIGPQPGFEVDLLRKNNNGFVNFFGFGDLDATALPNGAYTIRFTALKAGGDPTNPAHWEASETDTFAIDRFAFLD
ncbi:MAG: S8 family serine peptidase [Trueperaceae bacterium]